MIKRYAPYMVIAGVLLSAYYPVWTGYYLHTDDFFWSKWGHFAQKDVLKFAMYIGRPLAGLIFLCFGCIGKLAWMNVLRFLSVVNLCVAACLLFRWLCAHQLNRWSACFLSAAIFTLPSFQVYAAYVTTAAFGLAVTLSILAVMLVHRWWGVSIFLLLMAFALYQPGAFFYLTLLAVPLMTEKDLRSFVFWRKIFVSLAVFAAAALLYYVLWIGLDQWGGFPTGGKYDGRSFVTDIGARWQWFIDGPLVEASNFWNILPTQKISHVFIGLLGVVLVCGFIIQSKDSARRVRLGQESFFDFFKIIRLHGLKYVLLLLLIPVSYSVVLVSSAPSMGYRTYAALSTTLILLVILPFVLLEKTKYRLMLCGITGLLMIMGACSAYATVDHYFAIPDSKEIRYIIQSIREGQAQDPDFTGVTIMKISSQVSPGIRNEIGEPSTAHDANIRPIVMTALNELGITKNVHVFCCPRYLVNSAWKEYGLVFGKNLLDGPLSWWVYPQNHTIIIDMDRINDVHSPQEQL